MKVRINFTVDIDPEAWAEEYGTDLDGTPTRGDVQHHAQQIVLQHFGSLGLLA
ncbi:hypothetical protein SEA_PAITO_59 [Mycobacterium phage Paito]|uniref:Uncharacterized protein n=1 Tax=Mycobacterium phage Paito TaxID=2315544 RepID=A0A386KJR3_9CAUD|nr:hypothetical protein KDW68_gp59 [Mycobacterium phage Paito]AYD84643.1 hypothetical protein SEA_PAITO_59 [Mycobacterium phage Paito]